MYVKSVLWPRETIVTIFNTKRSRVKPLDGIHFHRNAYERTMPRHKHPKESITKSITKESITKFVRKSLTFSVVRYQ